MITKCEEKIEVSTVCPMAFGTVLFHVSVSWGIPYIQGGYFCTSSFMLFTISMYCTLNTFWRISTTLKKKITEVFETHAKGIAYNRQTVCRATVNRDDIKLIIAGMLRCQIRQYIVLGTVQKAVLYP